MNQLVGTAVAVGARNATTMSVLVPGTGLPLSFPGHHSMARADEENSDEGGICTSPEPLQEAQPTVRRWGNAIAGPAPPCGAGAGASRLSSMAWLDAGLRRELAAVARTPRLLVACDYDVTLATITGDPWSVRPLPEAVTALRSLAACPRRPKPLSPGVRCVSLPRCRGCQRRFIWPAVVAVSSISDSSTRWAIGPAHCMPGSAVPCAGSPGQKPGSSWSSSPRAWRCTCARPTRRPPSECWQKCGGHVRGMGRRSLKVVPSWKSRWSGRTRERRSMCCGATAALFAGDDTSTSWAVRRPVTSRSGRCATPCRPGSSTCLDHDAGLARRAAGGGHLRSDRVACPGHGLGNRAQKAGMSRGARWSSPARTSRWCWNCAAAPAAGDQRSWTVGDVPQGFKAAGFPAFGGERERR